MQLDLCESAPAEWLRLPISAVCNRFTSGGTPSRRVPDYFVGEIPWVKTQELTDCVLEETGEHISQEAVAASSAKLLPERTVLMAMYGATVGQLGVLAKPMTCNQACAAMVVDSDKADYRYLYYQLMAARKQIKSLSTGAAQQNLSGAQIKQFVLPFPPLWEQSAIADVLWQIDRRITLLRQTNATLESIAQALFKSWFIDFDPVRAKAEGREPEGMDAATAALFPAEFEESTLGLIPKGWDIEPIGELVDTVGGATPDTKNPSFWEPAVHHWTSPKDLSGATSPVLLATERKVSPAGLAKISSGLLPAGSLLMSSRAPIGYLTLTQVPVAINQGYIAMPPGGRLPPLYLYCWCKANMDSIKGRANGSTFMEISKKAFRPIPALLPSQPLIDSFVEIVGVLFGRLVANERQARALVESRDALLPRLISGKLRLSEAQAELGETLHTEGMGR